MLTRHADLPAAVARELAAAQACLRVALPVLADHLASGDAIGYFTPIPWHWETLHEETGILGIPASVFGSAREDITILSSLSFIA